MKLTKQKLKQIIKEELSQILSENDNINNFDDWIYQIIHYFEDERNMDHHAATKAVDDAEEKLRARWGAGGHWLDAADDLYSDYADGEGVAGETHEKTLADYKKHPDWFN